MEEFQNIITLVSLLVFFILPPGFMAARLYRAGYTDKKSDIWFYTCFFNFFSALGYLCLPSNWPLPVTLIISLFLPFLIMLVMKHWDYKIFEYLRKFKITSSNNYGTTWETIINNQRIKFCRIILYLQDGAIIESVFSNASFAQSPLKKFILDKQGNIGLHITAMKGAGQQDYIDYTQNHEEPNCHVISWIKSERIDRISIQYSY